MTMSMSRSPDFQGLADPASSVYGRLRRSSYLFD